MRTLQAGPVLLTWVEDEFKGELGSARVRVTQDPERQYHSWSWLIIYDPDEILGEVRVSQFDRAQTAADDLALFLRAIGLAQ